jgi:hypothetical protein
MNMEKNFRDWQAFSRILEVMSFMERIQELTPDEIRDAAQDLCELPADPQHTMSMQEVIFWAGVATGIELRRNCEEELLDDDIADKFLVYSSLFAYSTRNAVVDLTLQQLEPSQ